MTLDQRIRDFNKKLKAKDLILNEWYNFDSKVFTFNIWERNSKYSDGMGDCLNTTKSTSRREAFDRLVADFNKEQS